MLRFYNKKAGTRRYLDFDNDKLQNAIQAIQAGMSQRNA